MGNDEENPLVHISGTYPIRYGKPNLNNLPPEIGIPIFNEIMTAPKASTEVLDRLVADLRERIISETEEYN